jgi:hypothetical protein
MSNRKLCPRKNVPIPTAAYSAARRAAAASPVTECVSERTATTSPAACSAETTLAARSRPRSLPTRATCQSSNGVFSV